MLKPLFEAQHVEKLIHYAPFEQAWSIVHVGCPIANVYDTCAAFQSIQKEFERWETRADKGRAAIDEILPGWSKQPNGLAPITRRVHGFDLPKDEQASDWGEDELSDKQIEYAAMDVAVLPEVARVARSLAKQTGMSGRISWRCNKSREEAMEMFPAEMIRTADDSAEVSDAMHDATSLADLKAIGVRTRYLSISAVNRDSLEALYKQRFAALKIAD